MLNSIISRFSAENANSQNTNANLQPATGSTAKTQNADHAETRSQAPRPERVYKFNERLDAPAQFGPPAPCLLCESPIYWHSVYSPAGQCILCFPPPSSRALIAGIFLLILDCELEPTWRRIEWPPSLPITPAGVFAMCLHFADLQIANGVS